MLSLLDCLMVNPSQKIPTANHVFLGKLRFYLAKSLQVAPSPVLDGLTSPEMLTGRFSLNSRHTVVSTAQT